MILKLHLLKDILKLFLCFFTYLSIKLITLIITRSQVYGFNFLI